MNGDNLTGTYVEPRVRLALDNATRFPTRTSVNAVWYWLSRWRRDVNIIRAKVDARIDRRRELFQSRGQSPDHRGFVTPHMREELELLYALESGVAAAFEEYKALKAKVEGHGT